MLTWLLLTVIDSLTNVASADRKFLDWLWHSRAYDKPDHRDNGNRPDKQISRPHHTQIIGLTRHKCSRKANVARNHNKYRPKMTRQRVASLFFDATARNSYIGGHKKCVGCRHPMCQTSLDLLHCGCKFVHTAKNTPKVRNGHGVSVSYNIKLRP